LVHQEVPSVLLVRSDLYFPLARYFQWDPAVLSIQMVL